MRAVFEVHLQCRRILIRRDPVHFIGNFNGATEMAEE